MVNRLNEIVNVLTFQTGNGECFVFSVHGIENHAAHAFLELVDVVEEYFQLHGVDVG